MSFGSKQSSSLSAYAWATLATTLLAVLPSTARAQYSWVNSTNQTGNWNASARWTGGAAGTFPNAVDATATLNPPLSTAPSGNYNVQLSATAGQLITIGGLTINNYVGVNDTGDVRIGANGNGSLTFQSSSGPAFYTDNAGPGTENTSAGTTNIFAPITFASDTVITQNHAITNNNGTVFNSNANSPGGITAAPNITVTKAGDGNVSFTVAPTAPATGFQGALVINGGAVRDTVGALQNAASVTVNSGGQLQLASATVTDWALGPGAVLTLNGTGKANGVNGTGALRSNNNTSVSNFNSPVVLASDTSIDVNGPAAKLTLTQNVSGPGGFNKADAGTLVLGGTAANTYGGVTKAQAGTLVLGKPDNVTAVPGDINVQNPTGATQGILQLAANNQIADTSVVTINISTGTGTPNGLFSLNGFQETIGGLNSTVGGGIVQNGSASAPSTLSINSNAAASSFTGLVQDGGAGALSLVIEGSQPVSLSGANTYTGGTTVLGGTLLADSLTGSATGTGTVTVIGGTLGGSGAIAGPVTISGGSLAPGDSPGTLTVGGLALDPASLLLYQLGAPGIVGSGTNDLTEVNGDLTVAGALVVTDAGGFAVGVYRLFDYTGSFTDNGLSIGSLPNGFAGILDESTPGQVNLLVSAVPEPSSLLLAGLGSVALGLSVWNKRRKSHA